MEPSGRTSWTLAYLSFIWLDRQANAAWWVVCRFTAISWLLSVCERVWDAQLLLLQKPFVRNMVKRVLGYNTAIASVVGCHSPDCLSQIRTLVAARRLLHAGACKISPMVHCTKTPAKFARHHGCATW
jgi:hypothetical protein